MGRAGAQELRDEQGRCDHVLEVVEDEQAGARREVLHQQVEGGADAAVGQPHGAGDRASHQPGLSKRLERHEPDPVRVAVRGRGRDLERQARLPDAAGAGEGQEPRRVQRQERGREVAVAIVQVNQVAFGLCMLTFELVVASLILWHGTAVRLGVWAGVAFLLGITPLGVEELPNPILAVGLAVLATRDFPKSALGEVREALRRRLPGRSAAA